MVNYHPFGKALGNNRMNHRLCIIILAALFLPSAAICQSSYDEQKQEDKYIKKSSNNKLVSDTLVSERRSHNTGFWDKKGADDIFNGKLNKQDRPPLQFIVVNPSESEEKKDEDTSQPAESPTPNIEETLLDKFGSPEEDAPVLANKDAPKPMQAMFMALEEGRQDLAVRYARQLVKYFETVNERSRLIGEMSQLVKIARGDVSEETLPEVDFDGKRELLDVLKDYGKQDGPSGELELDQKALSLLNQVNNFQENRNKAEQGIDKDNRPLTLKEEESLRIETRRLIANFPLAKDGKLSVYLFIRQSDEDSMEMLRKMVLLSQLHKCEFKALLLDTTKVMDAIRFKSKAQLPFKVEVGNRFAKLLKVSQSPTMVFFVPGEKKVWAETGDQEIARLDEIIRLIMNTGKVRR